MVYDVLSGLLDKMLRSMALIDYSDQGFQIFNRPTDEELCLFQTRCQLLLQEHRDK